MENNIDIMIQLILVEAGIRNAWLVDIKNSNLNSILRSRFKSLVKSYTNFGLIISKNNYNKQKLNNKSLGDILGYPCGSDFEIVKTNKVDSYTISVCCELNDRNTFEIFVNRAIDLSKLYQFEEFAKSANQVLKSHRSTMNEVKNVYVKISEGFSYNTIKKAIINNNMNDKLTEEFKNYLWNLEYDDLILNFNFDFSNKVHKTVALMLITECENDVSEQFYPFDEITDKLYCEVMKEKSKNVYEILNT